MDINSVTFCGRLTGKPELKALPSGQNVANFSIASNEKYTKDGETKENVEFGNIVVFGKQADNCAKYLEKGQIALVEGKMQTRSWDKDGQKMYRTEIVAQRVQFGPKVGVTTQTTGERAGEKAPDYPEQEINPENIPF